MPSFTSSSDAGDRDAGARVAARAALVAVVVACALEGGIAWRFRDAAQGLGAVPYREPGRIPTVEESVIEWQVLAAARGIGPQDILFLGDSSCLTGVRPDILERLTGLRCQGLATIGWTGLQGSADMLEIVLRNAPPPRVVVVQVSWLTLTLDRADFARTETLGRFRAWIGREPPPLVASPSRRYRDLIRAEFAHDSAAEADRLAHPRGPYPSHDELRGVLQRQHGGLEDGGKIPLSDGRPVTGRISDEALAGFERLAAIASGAGSQLHVVLAPLPASSEPPTGMAPVEEAQGLIRERVGPRATFARPWVRFYPDELFATPTHPNAAGALRNTEEMAAGLREQGLPRETSKP